MLFYSGILLYLCCSIFVCIVLILAPPLPGGPTLYYWLFPFVKVIPVRTIASCWYVLAAPTGLVWHAAVDMWRPLGCADSERFALVWESEELKALNNTLFSFVKNKVGHSLLQFAPGQLS